MDLQDNVAYCSNTAVVSYHELTEVSSSPTLQKAFSEEAQQPEQKKKTVTKETKWFMILISSFLGVTFLLTVVCLILCLFQYTSLKPDESALKNVVLEVLQSQEVCFNISKVQENTTQILEAKLNVFTEKFLEQTEQLDDRIQTLEEQNNDVIHTEQGKG